MYAPPPEKIALISWNVGWTDNNAGERIECILRYIQHEVLESPSTYSPEPCVILFQAVRREAFATLLADEWVRRCFVVVPTSRREWPPNAEYANVTLVSITVSVGDASMLILGKSRMNRSALLTDLCLRNPYGNKGLRMRIANTHLDSLARGADFRPDQLWSISHILRHPGIVGGIVGGDMNAISENDIDINARAGLADAYQADPNDPRGFTWGYQPPTGHSPGRLDKFFYTPEETGSPPIAVRILPPTVIGIGLHTRRGEWVSDHYGIFTRTRFKATGKKTGS